ncbi:hypothetical protein [Burkholderia cenocepacia]|uniref:hypothetical protein n=1 Tax=Burkholderia cenocepacia TaxID=95486 RepID=UPI000F598F7D|nr:hypothetical protein [Burkholderia cenocepacia]
MSKGPVDDGNDDIAKRILDWADCTNATAARISKMDFFIFGLNTFYNCAQYFSRFGQLCEISPPSPVIKSYFKSVAGEWRQEYRGFGDFSERVVLKGINRASLSILFDFYVRTQVLSSSPPSFVGRFGGLLDRLRRQHATCGCNWFGVKSTSGEIAWRECALGDKRIRERCPYEIVFAELEERWGKWTEIYERRRANQEFGRLIAVSQNLRDFGFVQLASDRATNRAEYFDRLHDLLGNFTWVIDASILNMLNTATTWQIETEVAAVTAWLGRIDRANRPPLLNIPGECVRLQQHGVGLRLMRWVWRYPTPVSSQLFRNGADSAG